MAKNNETIAEFVISRTFDVPRDVLWKAFTDPERMKLWWGPKGVKIIHSKMDFRPGGMYHYGMQTPQGEKMWGKFIYREIDPQNKMIFVNSFSDEKGGITRHPLNKNWPLQMLSTFIFEEHQGKTTLTIKWLPLNPTEQENKTFNEGREDMKQGWTGTLEQLEEYLKSTKRGKK